MERKAPKKKPTAGRSKGRPSVHTGETPKDFEIPDKRPVGHPPIYATAEELAAAIDKYFKSLARTEDNMMPPPPTLAGLAYELGYESRQSLTDQEKRGSEFSYCIRRAKCFIESCHEGGLYGTSATGHIFWLKNHAGYVDVQGVNLAGADGGPFGIYKMSRADAMARLAELREKQDAE